MIFQSICFCFVPLLLIFAAFYAFIPGMKLTTSLLSVLAGFIAIVPVGALNIYVFSHLNLQADSLCGVLLRDILLNGFVEETFKMLLIWMLIHKAGDLRTFFFYAVLAGLSVGCFELFIYFPSWSSDIETKFFIRMGTAVVLHALCAGLSGIFVWSFKQKKRRVLPYAFAVIFHGLYNYFAGFKMNVPFFYFSFAVLVFALIECRIRYVRLNELLEKEAD